MTQELMDAKVFTVAAYQPFYALIDEESGGGSRLLFTQWRDRRVLDAGVYASLRINNIELGLAVANENHDFSPVRGFVSSSRSLEITLVMIG